MRREEQEKRKKARGKREKIMSSLEGKDKRR